MLAFGEDGLAAHSDHIYKHLPNMETMEDAIFRKMILTICKSHGILENAFGAIGRNQTKLDGDTFIKVFTDQAILQTLVSMGLRGVFKTQRSGIFMTEKRRQAVDILDIFTSNMEITIQVCGKEASEKDFLHLPELLRQSLITGVFARQGDYLIFQTDHLAAKGARHQVTIRRDVASTFINLYMNSISELIISRAWQPLEIKKFDSLSYFQRTQLKERYRPFCEERRQAIMFGVGGSAWKLLDKGEEDERCPDMKDFEYCDIHGTLLWVQLPKP